MSLRIDLMRQEEYRYQGAVSRKFAGRAAVGLVVGGFLVWVVMAVQSGLAVRSELAQLETEWSGIKSHYELLQKKRSDYVWSLGLQNELKPWASNRVDWASLMDELNDLVPRNIQLTRLIVRSDWSMVRPPPSPPPTDPAAQAPPPPAGLPAQRFSLSLSGRAAGDAGSDAAVKMVRQLKDSPAYSAVFETIRLQNLIREERTGDKADRSFSIDGVGILRKLE